MVTNILIIGIAGFGVDGKKQYQFIDENTFMEIVAVCDKRFNDDNFRYFAKKMINYTLIGIYEVFF